MIRFVMTTCLLTTLLGFATANAAEPIALGTLRELFVDHYLIDKLTGTRLELHAPRDEGKVLAFDQPWEGQFSGYCTLIRDGDLLRMYYRGRADAGKDGEGEVTCMAESADGKIWSKPKLGLIEFNGSKDNNLVFATEPYAHNFCPMLDTNPAALADQRYKAIGGTRDAGLATFCSPDGLHWKRLSESPALTLAQVQAAIPDVKHLFDSQNVAFWSEAEKKYLMYFRIHYTKVRRIARAESSDFVTWTNIRPMEYARADGFPAPLEQLYTNQTHPYFRAPQLSLAIAARFMKGRQVLSNEEATALGVDPGYFKDTADAILLSTRGGATYDRTFMEAFIKPGIGPQNWVSRTNYPALNVVQTGPTEMSVYLNQDYAQKTAHVHRYSLRLDGFVSVSAPYDGGELLTKPLTFKGDQLALNFATSAAGGIRVEIQDANGQPIPGYTLDDSVELIGNEIERRVRWKDRNDVSSLSDRPVRLRFVMKDADLYSLQFTTPM